MISFFYLLLLLIIYFFSICTESRLRKIPQAVVQSSRDHMTTWHDHRFMRLSPNGFFACLTRDNCFGSFLLLATISYYFCFRWCVSMSSTAANTAPDALFDRFTCCSRPNSDGGNLQSINCTGILNKDPMITWSTLPKRANSCGSMPTASRTKIAVSAGSLLRTLV